MAFSARHLGLDALIVMPKTTPAIKVEAVSELGAGVVLNGDTYTEAKRHCDELVQSTGRTFVHPFDDELVIAGQGTVGHEILRHKLGGVDAIFVPVGGGGLIAGIASYVKALRPEVDVIGVEPFEADAMYQSLAMGRRVVLDRVGIFADGVAVQEVGRLTFPIVQSTVREIVRVSNDEICAAIKDIFDDTRSVMEPAGALAVAGLRTWVERTGTRNARLAAILSGANMNFDRLRFVAERAELGESREALFGVTIPERPGAFRELLRDDRPPRGHRVQLPAEQPGPGTHLRRHRDTVTTGRRGSRSLAERERPRGDQPERQRARQAARQTHGRRALRRGPRRARLSLRVSGAAGRVDGFPRQAGRALEHQPVPLPQSRRRLRSRPGRLRGAGRRSMATSKRFSKDWDTRINARRATRPTSCSSVESGDSRPSKSFNRRSGDQEVFQERS